MRDAVGYRGIDSSFDASFQQTTGETLIIPCYWQ